jgi:Tfp pilus assembly protein PilZ
MELYTDIRDKKRFNCNAEVSHDNLLPDVFYPAKMYNFSKGGLYFESDQRLYIGDYINFRLKYPARPSENDTQYQLGVEILWRQEAQHSSLKYGYGSKFINPHQTLENIIDLSRMEKRRNPKDNPEKDKDPRIHPRRPYNRSLVIIAKNRNFKGMMTNISRSGAFIKTQNQFSVGQIVAILVPGNKKQKDVKLKGYVVRLNRSGVGVIFDRRRAYRNRRSDLDRRTGKDRRGPRRPKRQTAEPTE